MLKGTCKNFKRKKSMTVSDSVIEADFLKGFFLINVAKAAVCFGKQFANNPLKALEIASIIGTSRATKDLAGVLSSTPDLIHFATKVEGIRLAQKEEVYNSVQNKNVRYNYFNYILTLIVYINYILTKTIY